MGRNKKEYITRATRPTHLGIETLLFLRRTDAEWLACLNSHRSKQSCPSRRWDARQSGFVSRYCLQKPPKLSRWAQCMSENTSNACVHFGSNSAVPRMLIHTPCACQPRLRCPLRNACAPSHTAKAGSTSYVHSIPAVPEATI